jgi:hypothetical protein
MFGDMGNTFSVNIGEDGGYIDARISYSTLGACDDPGLPG